MAFVSLAENGERNFTFARKPGADMFLRTTDVKEKDIDDSIIIHAGSCSLSAEPVASATRKAMQYGHQQEKIVSFDINYRNLMWKDEKDKCINAVHEILPYIDILKISEEELDMVGGEDNIEKVMQENGLTTVVLTLGSEGAKVFSKEKHFLFQERK